MCLCMPPINFECLNQSLWNLVGTSWQLIWMAYFIHPSHQSACLYFYPHIIVTQRLARNATATTNKHWTIETLRSYLHNKYRSGICPKFRKFERGKIQLAKTSNHLTFLMRWKVCVFWIKTVGWIMSRNTIIKIEKLLDALFSLLLVSYVREVYD
jgi:hypothetical protein